MHLGATLAYQDIAGQHVLATVALDAQPPPCRVAAVARGAASLLVCHGPSPQRARRQPPRISLMRTVVWCWRWPRLRREFLRRRFLKAMTLGARPWSTTSATTLAPAIVGLPTLASVVPASIKTSVNSTLEPASPATFSMVSTSSAATRYCLPPVFMTAYIVDFPWY